jgi:hypothetical protein
MFQVICAAFSHPILDLFVGVVGIHLFWPFGKSLDFPLVCCLGSLSLTNYYLYKNLFIELGVLTPLFYRIYLWVKFRPKIAQKICKVAGLMVISIGFMIWAFLLDR